MSELIHEYAPRNSRRYFLATVSISALFGLSTGVEANANEMALQRPSVWIELGGELEQLRAHSDFYIPPFGEVALQHGLISPATVQKIPKYSLGESGRLTLQPSGSNWTFSASIRYGRSNTKAQAHQEITIPGIYYSPLTTFKPGGPNGQPIPKTADYNAKSTESHTVLDFNVGRDVGLGILPRGSSHFDFGVRIAQFTSKASLQLLADPDPHLGSKYFPSRHRSLPVINYFQFYRAEPHITHNFRGIGPSLIWSGSAPILNTSNEEVELAFDLGVNFSVLFGRQKTGIQHHTTGDRNKNNFFANPKYVHDIYTNHTNADRSQSVVIPNIGAMTGISLKFPNAKVALGYRADFFLGAVDGGIETRKSYDRNFYGPYASISIGFP